MHSSNHGKICSRVSFLGERSQDQEQSAWSNLNVRLASYEVELCAGGNVYLVSYVMDTQQQDLPSDHASKRFDDDVNENRDPHSQDNTALGTLSKSPIEKRS